MKCTRAATRPKPYDFTDTHLTMETFMRMLESIGPATWTTCEECGNDFPAGTYRCGRCGHTPNFLRRLASFSAAAFQKKSIRRPRRSQGAYPGLAEGALKFYQARRKRVERLIWIGLLASGVLIVWALSGAHSSDMDLKPQSVSSHTFASGAVVQNQAASASASPVQPPAAASATPGAAEFYRAMESRNLTVAHRRLAAMPDKGDANGQLQQMRAQLTTQEHLRDGLLHRAWHCRAIGDWKCVSESAAQASGVDASSVSARRLVSQAAQASGN
jgi:hypothetical protein